MSGSIQHRVLTTTESWVSTCSAVHVMARTLVVLAPCTDLSATDTSTWFIWHRYVYDNRFIRYIPLRRFYRIVYTIRLRFTVNRRRSTLHRQASTMFHRLHIAQCLSTTTTPSGLNV